MASPITPVPTITFPIEVEVKLKFLAETQDDYDYLTLTSTADVTNRFSIIHDAVIFEDELGIKCVEVNGVRTDK